MNNLTDIQGLLFDLDGVLYVGDQMIAGADLLIERLKQRRVPCRFVTNTTTQSREAMANKLQAMGLPISAAEITSTPSAAMQYMQRKHYASCYLLLNEQVKQEFSGLVDDDVHPDAIVLGDIGEAWNYSLLNGKRP